MVEFWTNTIFMMTKKKFDQEKLAELAGVSKNTLAGWISKDRIPRADEAFRLAQALDTSVEYLLTGEDVGSPCKAQLISDFLERQIQDRKAFMQSLMDIE